MHRTVVVLLLALSLAACGGSGKNSTTPPPTGTTPPPATGGSTAPAVQTAALVPVVAGQTAGGVDITVGAPAGGSSINAELLGVGLPGSTISAANTGDQIHRGDIKVVIVFGAGLTGTEQVTISGPLGPNSTASDIDISDVRAIQSKSGKPGVAFNVVVHPDAALGARTVFLRASNDNIAAFTGGLEVIP